MSKRVDNAELERRVEAVLEMIVSGFTTAEICHFAAQEKTAPDGSGGWNVSARQASRYIAAAMALLDDAAKPKRARMVTLAERRFTKVFNLALKSGDLRTALQAQKELSELFKLDGLLPDEKRPLTMVVMPHNGRDYIEPERRIEWKPNGA